MRTKETPDLKSGGGQPSGMQPWEAWPEGSAPMGRSSEKQRPTVHLGKWSAGRTSAAPMRPRRGKQRLASTCCLPNVGRQLSILHGTPRRGSLSSPGCRSRLRPRVNALPRARAAGRGCRGPPSMFRLGRPTCGEEAQAPPRGGCPQVSPKTTEGSPADPPVTPTLGRVTQR